MFAIDSSMRAPISSFDGGAIAQKLKDPKSRRCGHGLCEGTEGEKASALASWFKEEV